MNDIVKQRISMMICNTLKIIAFVVLAIAFSRWWISLFSALFIEWEK